MPRHDSGFIMIYVHGSVVCRYMIDFLKQVPLQVDSARQIASPQTTMLLPV